MASAEATDTAALTMAGGDGKGPTPACKGKGPAPVDKGKGKGPTPAAVDKGQGKDKGKDKGKGKAPTAQGGFAPNIKKLTKPELWGVFQLLVNQREDGGYDNAAMGAAILGLYQSKGHGCPGIADPGIDFGAELEALGPAGATAFILSAMECWARNLTYMEHTTVTVQSVGDGRGNAKRDEYDAGKWVKTPEEARKMVIGFGMSPQNEGKMKLGARWLDAAEAFMAQHPHEGLKSKAAALADAWLVTKMFEKKGTKAVSEEDRKRKEEEQRQKSLQRQQEQEAILRHWRSLGSLPVDDVPWSTACRGRWCSGGMGGATLVQLGDGAVVLKEIRLHAVPEVVAAELANALGASVARSRVLHDAEDEWLPMLRGLAAMPFDGEQTMFILAASHAIQRKEDPKKTVQAKFLMVLEYVSGVVLQGLDGNGVLQSDAADAVLTQVGRLIAFDCLLNNVDRVPAIWMNDGNFSNIMLTKDNVVKGIDQQVNAIGDPAGREKYLASVRDFAKACAAGDLAAASMKRIRTGFLENTGVELSDAQCRCVCEGATSMFQQIARDAEERKAFVARLPERLRDIFGASADIGLEDVAKISGFLQDCIDVIGQAV